MQNKPINKYQMNLIIVESPTKARTLAHFLGNEYKISSTMGHIRDLPSDRLGVDVSKDFKPQYKIIADRTEEVEKIKKEAEGVDSIILATDPDREGEAIAWHVANVMGKWKVGSEKIRSKKSNHTPNLQRIVFHEITQSAINNALAHPRNIDMKLVDAQQARRVLDRLVGYKLSPLLWYKVRKGLSAGRVQSVAVRLIVEREREIEAFKPQEYWVIEARLGKKAAARQAELGKTQNSKLKTGQTFLAKLVKKDGRKYDVKDKKTADSVVKDLKKASYVVKDVKKKEVKRYPYPPFTTSTMQQTAANFYGWTAKKTMQLAQKLYEEGLITYHRTDSTNIASEAITKVRTLIAKLWGSSFLPDSPRIYKTKSKVAQEAHEAIRPTKIGDQKSENRNQTGEIQLSTTGLGRETDRLYHLIWKRFVACQMKEAIYDKTTVDISASSYLLRAVGSIIKFEGWQTLAARSSQLAARSKNLKLKTNQKDKSNFEVPTSGEEKQLPPLNIGEHLDLIKLLPQQKFTEPLPRYNEASLIRELEEKGIGRPSTYAPILSTIQERIYVEKKDRRFIPTQLGTSVNDFLVKHFPDVVSVSFTAKMEDELDAIARGEIAWVPVVREFYSPFNDRLTATYQQAKRVKIEAEKTGEMCPECKNPLVLRIGKFGRFVACSSYPQCRFTKPHVEKAGVKCPKCSGEIILKKTKRGKRFYGCGNYPKCDFARWKKP